MTQLTKRFCLLVVLLLVVSLALAACGGDDDDDGGGGDQNTGDTGARTITLSETFEGPYGITVRYPQGWVASQQDTMVAVVSSAAVQDRLLVGEGMSLASSECMVGIFAGHPDDPTVDLTTAFNQLVEAEYSEASGITHTGAIEDITVGGRPAKRLNIGFVDHDVEGVLIAFADGDVIVFGMVLAGKGGLGNFEATGLAIFDSVTYSAPTGS